MVLTSVQQDKTLKNSVDLYYIIHQKQKGQALLELERSIQWQKEEDAKSLVKTAGRPKKYTLQLPKSLEKDISLNTAAYSKARERVPIELTNELFIASRIGQATNSYTHWNGYRVFSGDGTYIQMQDTESIREKYEVKHNGVGSEGYPQGLLEVIIERGTGQLYAYKLSNRHTSELSLFYDMLDDMPPKSLLLLDDLYNCFEIISKCKRLGIEIVVPDKKERMLPESKYAELCISLATYNLIRKIIYASIKSLPFFPKEDFIHQFYTLNQDILIDKKGRVYNRWSSGRRRNEAIDIKTTASETKTKQTI